MLIPPLIERSVISEADMHAGAESRRPQRERLPEGERMRSVLPWLLSNHPLQSRQKLDSVVISRTRLFEYHPGMSCGVGGEEAHTGHSLLPAQSGPRPKSRRPATPARALNACHCSPAYRLTYFSPSLPGPIAIAFACACTFFSPPRLRRTGKTEVPADNGRQHVS